MSNLKQTQISSRRFTLVNVPDPEKISANFVYNFFVPDERENSLGDNRIAGGLSNSTAQRLVSAKTLSTEIPRYVEITFSPGTVLDYGNFGNSKDHMDQDIFTLDQISNEEEITNESFFALRESDPNCKFRMSQKLQALSKLMDVNFESSDQSQILAEEIGVSKSDILPLISPYGRDLQVNFKAEEIVSDIYSRASENVMNSLVNKRQSHISVAGVNDISPISNIDNKKKSQEIAQQFLAICQDNSVTLGDVEPTLKPFSTEDVQPDTSPTILGASLVGYVLSRSQFSSNGKIIGETKTWPIFGRNNTTFLDAEIIYGSKYAYSVRNVFRIDAIADFTDDGLVNPKRIGCLIASKPTHHVFVATEDNAPPSSPDGVFYRFNYDAGKGLMITWQMPSGRSRDVKYFQVFKRFSIYEPFTCIAELDFDDSTIKILKTETVREDLVRESKPGFPVTYFEDKSFNRDARPAIYAICAIDAHGLTSGYSTQTQVGFDRIKNKITLKNISRPDAPKQYPNFYVDPDLDDNIAVDSFTQDAIFDSGRSRVDIYFTPDARIANTKSGNSNSVFVTNSTAGSYSMHVINLDLQKSDTATIYIEDLRKSA